MSQSIYQIAAAGFGAGTNDLYDRARPSYQPSAIAQIHRSLHSHERHNLNVAEIGSGTGIFTRALLNHVDWADPIQELRAVEPSAGMRELFSKTVIDSRVSVQEGTFEATSLPDGWADVVIIAQAFHWCPDYNKASVEIARILKPTGTLALIWNLEDRQCSRWVAELRERIEQHEQGTPQFRLGLWRKCFETDSYRKFFEPPREDVFDYILPAAFDGVIERACSKSYIAVLGDNEKKQVIADVEDILNRGHDLTWIDKGKGVFEYPYKCHVVISQRLP